MKKKRRFTVRLTKNELKAIYGFSNEQKIVASVAVRMLVALGLVFQNVQQPRLYKVDDAVCDGSKARR